MSKLCSTEFYLKETQRENKATLGKRKIVPEEQAFRDADADGEEGAHSPLRMQGPKDTACLRGDSPQDTAPKRGK